MIKQHPLGYLGMHQDMSKSKTKGGFYFSAENIRIKATDKSSSFGLTNVKGNELLLSIPTIRIVSIKTRFEYTSIDFGDENITKTLKYSKETSSTPGCEIEENFLPGGPGTDESGQQVIIGATDIRGGAVLATTDGNGYDCFWELKGVDSGEFTLDLLYCNDLGFSTQNQIQILYNYENSIIEKIYFVDGIHQLRFFNMRQSVENGDLVNLVDLRASSINNVSSYDLSQPQIVASDGGGVHTAGMIQYGYNLYILNGSQTTISPLSQIKPIAKGGNLGGGTVNEQINRTMLVNINSIDTTYTHIRIYAVKYTSYNEVPQVSLIADREIDNYESMSYYDDGNIIETITPEEFLFLGSDPFIPKHIESKDNRLFNLSIKEKAFDVNIDARCYGHDVNGDVKIWENIKKNNEGELVGPELTVNTTTYSVPEKHDSINRDYSIYKYTKDGTSDGLKEASLVKVIKGPSSTGNILIIINGTASLVPVVAGDSPQVTCQKMRDFLITDVPDHTFGMTVIQNSYYLTILNNNYGDTPNTICSDQNGAEFTVITQQNGIDGGTALGAEGKFFRLSLTQKAMDQDEISGLRLLKDREIYRFGIVFYNVLGQESLPKWICDVQAPKGNLEGTGNQVKFDIKSEFYTWLDSQNLEDEKKPIGYKLVKADRRLSDRTVLTQGIINPMINNFPGNNLAGYGTADTMFLPTTTKMPSVIRTFEDLWPFAGINNWRPLQWNSNGGFSNSGILKYTKEEFRAAPEKNMISNSYQFNSMMQLFSPELMFENVSIDSSYKLRVIGMVKESGKFNWGREFRTNNLSVRSESKFSGGFTLGTPGVTITEIESNAEALYDNGFFGPCDSAGCVHVNQMYREFKDGFISAPNEITYEMYGTPEVSQRGMNGLSYNKDDQFKYNNNLTEFRVDIFDQGSTNDGAQQALFGDQSNGAQCITFVEGSDDRNAEAKDRQTLDDFKNNSGITENAGLLMAEFVRDEEYKYVGNLYRGNTYEAKSVNDYSPVGEFTLIETAEQIIESPGDTYVSEFRFSKLSKTGQDLNTNTYSQTTEIVSYYTETTVDLVNRADKSPNSWDSIWQPDYEEFHDYNRVYSQQANLVKTTAPGFKFKEIKEFDTRVLASKLKSPGEAIDSWSDPLVNEVLDLDGKYGPITGTANFKDQIYALQANATAKLSINPRAQVTASDGLSLELGTGGVLSDYDYLSTEYGTLNKWSVRSTENGFYYFDVDKKSILRVDGNGLQSISSAAGMHSFFQNNINRSDLILDNPVNLTGVSSGYDASNGDMFMTFLQSEIPDINNPLQRGADASNHITICWNEETNSFTSFYGFHPSFYLPQGNKIITTNYNSNELWLQGVKGSNKFYGTRFDSRVNFTVSPETFKPSIYTNLTYNMEAKDQDGNDIPNATFDKISVRNEYQDSTFRNIILRKNAKRRDRLWNVTLPREYGTRNRIKSSWCTIELILNNDESYEMIAHDLIVSYTEY